MPLKRSNVPIGGLTCHSNALTCQLGDRARDERDRGGGARDGVHGHACPRHLRCDCLRVLVCIPLHPTPDTRHPTPDTLHPTP
eukprot:2411013-Rhodomonas_salina.2